MQPILVETEVEDLVGGPAALRCLCENTAPRNWNIG